MLIFVIFEWISIEYIEFYIQALLLINPGIINLRNMAFDNFNDLEGCHL